MKAFLRGARTAPAASGSALPVVRTVSAFARAVPPATTILASALAALPVVADAPTMPPAGLLVVIGWRLLRPDLWQAWMAIPLGLADDLLTGQPIGAGMAAWTITFLVLDLVDNRLLFRDYWVDWGIAAVAILFCMSVGIWATGTGGQFHIFLPLIVVTILCFPLAERTCAMLDRWRLRR